MYCIKCGGQVSDDMAFCPTCGAPIDKKMPSIQQNLNGVQDVKSENALQTEDKWDVVAVSMLQGEERNFVKAIQQEMNVDLGEAEAVSKNLPLTLYSKLPKRTAENMSKIWSKNGAVTKAVESSVNGVRTVIDYYSVATSETPIIYDTSEKASARKKTIILGTIGQTFTAVASLLIILLPLFMGVNENGLQLHSIVSVAISKIVPLFGILTGSYTFSLYTFFDLMIIMFSVGIIALGVVSVIDAVKRFILSIRYAKACRNKDINAQKEIYRLYFISIFMKAFSKGASVLIIMGVFFIMFFYGLQKLIVVSLIVPILFVITGFILEKIASKINTRT